MTAAKQLVTVELRFTSGEDPEQLADRVREAVAAIVGKDALEEFRVRTMPLDRPKGQRGGLRPVE
jgi:acetylornithine deacetylase/succinyl-diaminopimelate desuccinylase-like protein